VRTLTLLPIALLSGCHLGALLFAEGEGLPCEVDADCAPAFACAAGVCAPAASPAAPVDAGDPPPPVEEDAGPVEDDAGAPVEDAGVPPVVDAGADAGPPCDDPDEDGYGFECPLGSDCAPSDSDRHTTRLFFVDGDGDGFGVGAATGVCAGDGAPAGFALVDGDNCPDDANADQADRNGDGAGDACDDEDGDDISDADDNCPDDFNPDQDDRNGDGEGDECDDEDGDGVVDDEDNCPDDDNADQHDEDADDVGDVCDNCPADANPDQDDTTEVTPDGVGDACDPEPDEANAILFFDPFTSLRAEWQGVLAGYQINGDDLVQTNQEPAEEITLPGLDLGNARVESEVTVVSGALASGVVNVAVGGNIDSANRNGHLCSVRADSPTSFELSARLLESGAANNELAGTPMPEDLLGTHRVKMDMRGTELTCLRGGTGLTVTTTVPGFPGDDPGLRTNRAQARFAFFIVYALAP
jgi:hypothetical protein